MAYEGLNSGLRKYLMERKRKGKGKGKGNNGKEKFKVGVPSKKKAPKK